MTSRRSLRRAVLQQNLGIWRTRSGSDKTGRGAIVTRHRRFPCTTEADLSQKVQALSKSDKFAYRRQHSKPDPQFKFPKTFVGGCNRSFNHDWLDQHKWLCYSTMLNGASACHVCFSIVCRTLLARFLVHLSPSHFRHGRRNQPSLLIMRRPATHQCSNQLAEQLVHSVEHPDKPSSIVQLWES